MDGLGFMLWDDGCGYLWKEKKIALKKLILNPFAFYPIGMLGDFDMDIHPWIIC